MTAVNLLALPTVVDELTPYALGVLSVSLSPVDVAAALLSQYGLLFAHEYAHRSASKPYASPPISVGLVNLVVPAFITDTSATWLFPRRRRIWVNLAGPFVELLLIAPLSIALLLGAVDGLVAKSEGNAPTRGLVEKGIARHLACRQCIRSRTK